MHSSTALFVDSQRRGVTNHNSAIFIHAQQTFPKLESHIKVSAERGFVRESIVSSLS